MIDRCVDKPFQFDPLISAWISIIILFLLFFYLLIPILISPSFYLILIFLSFLRFSLTFAYSLLFFHRMFITQHYLAFSGWPEMRVLLELKEIINIEKSNTLYYIPNAILINSEAHGEFFFGSFIDRDVCFALLNNMSQIAKRLIEIKKDNNTLSPEIDELIFGLRLPKESYLGGIQAKATASWNALPIPLPLSGIPILSTGADSSLNSFNNILLKMDNKIENNDSNNNENYNNNNSNNNNDNNNNNNISDDDNNCYHSSNMNQSINEVIVTKAIDTVQTSSSSQIQSRGPGSSLGTTLPSLVAVNNNYLKDGIDLTSLYSKYGIVSLCTNVLPYHFSDVLRSCWLDGSGYG